MNKIVLVPDSFKGTMSSQEICCIMKKEILSFFPQAQVLSVPVADGGEGSVDAFLAAVGGEKITLPIRGPYFEPIKGFYGILPDRTAVIEMAAAAGLPLVGKRKRPDQTTTYGVGQLIAHAVESGCSRMIVGLGGSATNDGGAGAAAALGVLFQDENKRPFIPVGGTLHRISQIDVSGILPALRKIEMIAMCDIDNPLCGIHGAAAVFGPQKGADPQMVQRLDTVHFEELAQGADLIFSGEGKLDTQSLRGKVVIGTARRAKKMGIPLIAVVGDVGDDIEKVYHEGVSAVFSINRVAVPYEQAKMRAKNDLAKTMDNLMRLLQISGSF